MRISGGLVALVRAVDGLLGTLGMLDWCCALCVCEHSVCVKLSVLEAEGV